MANTLNGTIYTNIARRGFDYYLAALTAMQNFSTDFSAEVRQQGTSVQTRLIPAPAAARDLTGDLSGDYSAATTDMTLTAVTVNLDKHPVTGFHFTDTEYNRIAAGVMTDTVDRVIRTHAYTIAKSVLDNVFGLVKLAAFGNAALISTAANFDADDMADLRAVAVAAGWTPFLGNGAGAILSPTYYAALLKDAAIADYSASQSDALRSGVLPNVYGFRTIEAPTLPHNGEHLVGFISTPDALAVAMRAPATQASNRFEAYEVMVDDASGAVMTYAAIFTEKYRRIEHTFEVLHGASKANPQALKRIVGASGT
jgi:hypothetical protein